MINKIKKIIKDFGLSEIRAGMKITGKQLINDKITPLIEFIDKNEFYCFIDFALNFKNI